MEADRSGPLALIGNTWTNGVALAPEYFVEASSRVTAMSYTLELHKRREWADHVSMRMLITDSETMESWTTDVTEARSGGIILPADLSLSANCQMVLQLKAGDRTGKLYTPPYIPSYTVTIRYRY
jgi:hypothetical protein